VKKVILCDVDGVLADFVGALCAELRRKPEEIRHWELAQSLSPQEARVALEIMARPGFCHGLAWYDGAKEFLTSLRAEGDVFAVTAPFDGSETWERERKAWLAPYLERKRVFAVSGQFKQLVRGDVLIEDHPGTAYEWCRTNKDGIALLLDRPWNQPGSAEWQIHRRMYRARSYGDALTILRECA
jgi:5'(3')-deoxyribonucleotidase